LLIYFHFLFPPPFRFSFHSNSTLLSLLYSSSNSLFEVIPSSFFSLFLQILSKVVTQEIRFSFLGSTTYSEWRNEENKGEARRRKKNSCPVFFDTVARSSNSRSEFFRGESVRGL
jgi:hypothetical protein